MRISAIFWNIIYVVVNLILFLTIKDYIYPYCIFSSILAYAFAFAFAFDILSRSNNFKNQPWIFLTPIGLIGLAFAGIYYIVLLVEDKFIIPFNKWINEINSEVENNEPDYH